MIAKFDGVSGENLADLLTLIHGDDNRIVIPGYGQPMVIRLKDVKPDNQVGGTWYGLTLEIMETVPTEGRAGNIRVDPSYLQNVYTILGKEYDGEVKLKDEAKELWESFEREVSDFTATQDIRADSQTVLVHAGQKPTSTMLRILFTYVNQLRLSETSTDKIVVALKKVLHDQS